MAQAQRNIRLSPFNASSLDRSSGESGGIFYDQTNQTLRITDGRNNGGLILATRNWVVANIPPLPSQTNNANKYLTTNGSALSWATITIPPQVQSDWNATSGLGQILNKPTIPSLSGYATESYVDTAVSGATVDLTGYATESYVNTAISEIPTPTGFGNLEGLGFTRGVVVSEFSTDYSFTDNASDTVPVESAIRGYIDRRLGLDHGGGLVPQLNLISSGYLALNGALAMKGDINMATYGITNLKTPTANTDATTKAYVDGRSGVISVNGGTGAITNIATLDAEGKLTASQLPNSLSGAIVYKGSWNASTNTPPLADGIGTAGWEYVVGTGGTRNLGSGNITFNAGDWIIYNGTIWEKIPSNTIAAAGTLTGTTINSTVVNSSLTSVGTLTNLTVTNTITGSVSGNAGTVTNGVVTTGSYSDPSWLTLTAGKVGLGNVTNESKATMFTDPTFTGTVSGVTKTHVGLSNVTNESKATMFTSPSFSSPSISSGNLTFADSTVQSTANRWVFVSSGSVTAAEGATAISLTDNTITYGQYSKIQITGSFRPTALNSIFAFFSFLDSADSSMVFTTQVLTAEPNAFSNQVNTISNNNTATQIYFANAFNLYSGVAFPSLRFTLTINCPGTSGWMWWECVSSSSNSNNNQQHSQMQTQAVYRGALLTTNSVYKPKLYSSNEFTSKFTGYWEVYGMKK